LVLALALASVFGLAKICIKEVNPCSENTESRKLNEFTPFSVFVFPKKLRRKWSDDFSVRVIPR